MNNMTSMERVLTTLGHKEPDKIPLMLLLSIYGAKEMGISPKQYFSNADYVAKTQVHMQKKYGNDCLYSFFYAPIEIEAWQGEVLFSDDGPPNSGEPFLKSIESINSMNVPKIEEIDGLKKVLSATEKMKNIVGNEVPIIGVVMSPFSLPVMQLGFEKYLELMYFREKEFNKLMEINSEFCKNWANAQLKAGATAICYFNPLASPSMIERKKYLKTGYVTDVKTISTINGPTATHLASGRSLEIMDDLISSGTAIVGISAEEDLQKLKSKAKNKITLLGNLNGLDMENWSDVETEKNVIELMKIGGPGGGFILSDNHGEIPFYVKENTLMKIKETVENHGRYK